MQLKDIILFQPHEYDIEIRGIRSRFLKMLLKGKLEFKPRRRFGPTKKVKGYKVTPQHIEEFKRLAKEHRDRRVNDALAHEQK